MWITRQKIKLFLFIFIFSTTTAWGAWSKAEWKRVLRLTGSAITAAEVSPHRAADLQRVKSRLKEVQGLIQNLIESTPEAGIPEISPSLLKIQSIFARLQDTSDFQQKDFTLLRKALRYADQQIDLIKEVAALPYLPPPALPLDSKSPLAPQINQANQTAADSLAQWIHRRARGLPFASQAQSYLVALRRSTSDAQTTQSYVTLCKKMDEPRLAAATATYQTTIASLSGPLSPAQKAQAQKKLAQDFTQVADEYHTSLQRLVAKTGKPDEPRYQALLQASQIYRQKVRAYAKNKTRETQLALVQAHLNLSQSYAQASLETAPSDPVDLARRERPADPARLGDAGKPKVEERDIPPRPADVKPKKEERDIPPRPADVKPKEERDVPPRPADVKPKVEERDVPPRPAQPAKPKEERDVPARRAQEERARLDRAEAERIRLAQKQEEVEELREPQHYCLIVSGITHDHNGAFNPYRTPESALGPPYGSKRCEYFPSWAALKAAQARLKLRPVDSLFIAQAAHGAPGGRCGLDDIASGRPEEILDTLIHIAETSPAPVATRIQSCFSGDLMPLYLERIRRREISPAAIARLCIHTGSVAHHGGYVNADKSFFDLLPAGKTMEEAFVEEPEDALLSSGAYFHHPTRGFLIATDSTKTSTCPLDLPISKDLCAADVREGAPCQCHLRGADAIGVPGLGLVMEAMGTLPCKSTKDGVQRSFQFSAPLPDLEGRARTQACRQFTFPQASAEAIPRVTSPEVLRNAIKIVSLQHMGELIATHAIPSGTDYDAILCENRTRILTGIPRILSTAADGNTAQVSARIRNCPPPIHQPIDVQRVLESALTATPAQDSNHLEILGALSALNRRHFNSLCDVAQNSPDKEKRVQGLHMLYLHHVESAEGRSILLKALQAPSPFDRQDAAKLFVKLKPQDPVFLRGIAQTIAHSSDKFIQQQLALLLLTSQSQDLELLRILGEILKQPSDAYVSDHLVKLLKSARRVDSLLLSRLAAALPTSKSLFTKQSLAKILSESKSTDPEVLRLLVTALRTERDPYVRQEIMATLNASQTQNPEVLDALLPFLHSDESSLREKVIQILGNARPSDPKIAIALSDTLIAPTSFANSILAALDVLRKYPRLSPVDEQKIQSRFESVLRSPFRDVLESAASTLALRKPINPNLRPILTEVKRKYPYNETLVRSIEAALSP